MAAFRRSVRGPSILGAVLLLGSLGPTPAPGFQAREVEEPHRIVSAILSFPLPSSPVPGTALCVVDFDLPGAEQDLAVAYGWFDGRRQSARWFAAAGARFPDPKSLKPRGEHGPESPPLTLGPWAGLGAVWTADSGLRLAAEGRFTPAVFAVGDGDGPSPRFQVGLTAALTW